MVEIDSLFFQLIQVALDRRVALEKSPSEKEWEALLSLAKKQAVVGVTFEALDSLNRRNQKPPLPILYEWIGINEQNKQRNLLVNKRCIELEKLFSNVSYRCCVLKGQGASLYYNNPLCRQSGDIDLWVTKVGNVIVDNVRKDVLKFAEGGGYQISQIDIKHSDIDFFNDVPVEIHFMPSWMFNPFKNKKLQKYFAEQKNKQFGNYDQQAGFTHTTVDFDLVFSLVHIYRHVFEEGIGLRQLLDYYHILLHSDEVQRKEAFKVLEGLGMSTFAGGIMWVLKKCFAMREEYCICEENERHGSFLLSEIMIAGNFGHYDTRLKHQSKEKRWSNGFIQLKRNLHFLFIYPSEVLWSPFWKIWHYCWRKWKGYL